MDGHAELTYSVPWIVAYKIKFQDDANATLTNELSAIYHYQLGLVSGSDVELYYVDRYAVHYAKKPSTHFTTTHLVTANRATQADLTG